jgi:hypothetical protein
MKTLSLAVFAAAVGLVAAQTPDGFIPSVATHLDVTFGSKAVTPAGISLAKEGASFIRSYD